MARELVVPWSRARIHRLSFIRKGFELEVGRGRSRPNLQKVSVEIKRLLGDRSPAVAVQHALAALAPHPRAKLCILRKLVDGRSKVARVPIRIGRLEIDGTPCLEGDEPPRLALHDDPGNPADGGTHDGRFAGHGL